VDAQTFSERRHVKMSLSLSLHQSTNICELFVRMVFLSESVL